MLDFTKLPLHELLAMAANKARARIGDNRAMSDFHDLLEVCREFADAAHDDDAEAMLDAAKGLKDAAANVHHEAELLADAPDPDAGWDEESRVFETARAL